jgi:hypothetical protein
MFYGCHSYREEICAAASGKIPAANRAALEHHLKGCTECQQYREEIGNVVVRLAAAVELFSDIEPRNTTHERWARDFDSAIEPVRPLAPGLCPVFLDWSRDMMLPCRRIWSGMAAIWVVIFGLNISQRAKQESPASYRPSPQIMRALLASEGFLPGSGRSAENQEAKMQTRKSVEPGTKPHRESKQS